MACRVKTPTFGATSFLIASQQFRSSCNNQTSTPHASQSPAATCLDHGALTDGVHALQSAGLMFANIDNRMKGDPDYPIAEFNDFKRTYPGSWDEARSTLANYDPMNLASEVDASKVMLSAGDFEKSYYDKLASAVSGETPYAST